VNSEKLGKNYLGLFYCIVADFSYRYLGRYKNCVSFLKASRYNVGMLITVFYDGLKKIQVEFTKKVL
jgi:hypothetical protein